MKLKLITINLNTGPIIISLGYTMSHTSTCPITYLHQNKDLHLSKPKSIAFEIKYSIYHLSIQKAGRKRDTLAREQIRELLPMQLLSFN